MLSSFSVDIRVAAKPLLKRWDFVRILFCDGILYVDWWLISVDDFFYMSFETGFLTASYWIQK